MKKKMKVKKARRQKMERIGFAILMGTVGLLIILIGNYYLHFNDRIYIKMDPTIQLSDWEKFCKAEPMGEECRSVGLVEFDKAWFQGKSNDRVLPCWSYDEKTKAWEYDPDCIDLDSGEWIW